MKINSARTYAVVIPCYNHAKQLEHAIQSCAWQVLQPSEVIVVDDGSNEQTKEQIARLLRNYTSLNIICITQPVNMGVSAARNRGISAATSTIICFLDSDDVWHPYKLVEIDHTFGKLQMPRASVFHELTFDNQKLKQHDSGEASLRRTSFISLLLKNPVTPSTLAIPNGIDIKFREDMRYTEDHEFVLRLAKMGPLYRLNKELMYRARKFGEQGGLSSETWKMRKGEMKMYKIFCTNNKIFLPLLPILLVYSLVKHLRAKLTKGL